MIDKTVHKDIRTAIKEGDVEKVSHLIASDKDRLNMMTPFGTWLHVAASFGKLDIVERLVEMGANVNAYGGTAGGGPLNVAAAEGHIEIVRFLLNRGADLDVSEPERNPLFSAILEGHQKIVELLIDAGIDTNVRYTGESMKNMDALAFAHERGRTSIESMLSARRGANSESIVSPVDLKRLEPDSDILQHMVGHFGPVHDLALTEIITVSGVTIHVIPARTDEDPMVVFTTGMSSKPQNIPPGQEEYRYTELMVRLPRNWPLADLAKPENFWPFEWIKRIAEYPFENETWLGGSYAIISNGEPPEPLGVDTRLSCMMLLCETNDLNPIRCRDGRPIMLYTMIPLYTEERDLERERGVRALFDCLAAAGASSVIDPNRKNAVTGVSTSG